MKKTLCMLLTIAAFAVTAPAYAKTEAKNTDGYTVISGEGKLSNYTNIAPSPFTEDKENISYVAITSGITNIGNNIFKDCIYLRDVLIPSSVTTIGSQSFANCESLTKAVIPYGVTHIMSYAFAGCRNLTEVYIPDSVTLIGESAFYGCNNLTVYAGENSTAKTYCHAENIKWQKSERVHNTISDVLQDVKIIINGQELSYKYPVIMKNSTTMIPLRSIFEAVGCSVWWDDSTKTAFASKGEITLGLKTGSDQITVNGESKTLATPTSLICDNTMVHIRAVEHLGIQVEWNGETKTINIT